MSSEQIFAEASTSADSLRRASLNERDGHAAMFAAGICVVGALVFLAGQLGWWATLAAPAYIAGTVMAATIARGRAQSLAAIALSTCSMGVLVALMKVAGLA